MPDYGFVVGGEYTRADIYQICAVPPEGQKGDWHNGYKRYKDDWFVFCNIGTPGRTGHDYNNEFVGSELVWYGKNGSKLEHETIQSLLNPKGLVFIFYRDDTRAPFVYAGTAKAISHQDTVPVQITWSLNSSAEPGLEALPEEVREPKLYIEGATKTITVNAYERHGAARAACIRAHGVSCSVCGINFAEVYGKIGEGYIHVHHLVPLSNIKQEYELDPVRDLRPVCPNCHAMLHRDDPPYSIKELKIIVRNRRS
ncbi:DUF3427 domain-containing protein [Hahella sp. CR1]|uniref:DUF3427 domain-containing protein n=1 Tax=Hahella sp. CR1 TaxID=2992807 RepID=UPI002440EF1A|nr:DUF3427 domain-containing protein [Hahella sp. CR1]MDG9671837.1 DUF3427 domain-containing protein [Hahella sp. CR1]